MRFPSYIPSSSVISPYIAIFLPNRFRFRNFFSHCIQLSPILHTHRTHTYLRITIDIRFVTFLATRQCVVALSYFFLSLFTIIICLICSFLLNACGLYIVRNIYVSDRHPSFSLSLSLSTISLSVRFLSF